MRWTLGLRTSVDLCSHPWEDLDRGTWRVWRSASRWRASFMLRLSKGLIGSVFALHQATSPEECSVDAEISKKPTRNIITKARFAALRLPSACMWDVASWTAASKLVLQKHGVPGGFEVCQKHGERSMPIPPPSYLREGRSLPYRLIYDNPADRLPVSSEAREAQTRASIYCMRCHRYEDDSPGLPRRVAIA
jgi:hypothetical protein